MGQYWQIINLDKEQTLGCWGKLGEFLIDGSAATLVGLLSVPPPGSAPFDRFPEMTGSWAGDRIICVGDYGTDTPPGLLSEDEIADYTDDAGTLNLFDSAENHFPELRYSSSYFPDRDGHSWVLRNFTKREYVRSDAFAAPTDKHSGPYVTWGKIGSIEGPGFGEIVCSRICWSTDPSAAMAYDRIGLTRGVWAGDCFDIQIIDSLEGVEGWKDVSKEVTDEISEIWTSEFGTNWERN